MSPEARAQTRAFDWAHGWLSSLEQGSISTLRQPLCARQMAVPGDARPLGLFRRIDVQDSAHSFRPVDALGIGVEQALTTVTRAVIQ